jgi:hypothetical protein
MIQSQNSVFEISGVLNKKTGLRIMYRNPVIELLVMV